MKNLIMIIHANAEQDVADVLRGLDRIQGFTFTHVEGHGAQAEHDPFLSARDKVVGYTPRVRVDIFLEDADLEPVLDALRSSGKCSESHGLYWVTEVQRSGRL